MKSAKSPPTGKLRVYCLGPGIGESVVLHLPCGGWGVVDCYHTEQGGTVDFLQQMGVPRLKFFCLTHPHEDHYRGAHRLFDEYTGRIDRVWRFPGLTARDLNNLKLATWVRDKYRGDPGAAGMKEDYVRLLHCLIRESELLDDETFREIIGPYQILEDRRYAIDVQGPGTSDIREFQQRIANTIIKKGPMLLRDEGGEMINSISVVLTITFGDAVIDLLGDAQDPERPLDGRPPRTLVKIAHHGSANGRSANALIKENKTPNFDHGLLTPYTRSKLPLGTMAGSYAKACRKLVRTGPMANARYVLKTPVPGLCNPRLPHGDIEWVGLEISSAGKVKPIAVEKR